jgi:hypothetical protein
MSFIRPEARSVIWRWRESLAGFVVAIVGLYLAVVGTDLTQMFGSSMVVAAAVLMFAGLQRARFRVGTGGPGMVQVDEGQVTYFGPFEGGSVAIRQLSLVELDPKAKPISTWVLTEEGQPPLAIPTTAEGAEALFDVFAALDGIRTERMLAELQKEPKKRVVIWQRGQTAV